jgi:hypothetical protein
VRPEPHLYACAHLANSASLLLPVSNLTDLLAFRASGLSFARFARGRGAAAHPGVRRARGDRPAAGVDRELTERYCRL